MSISPTWTIGALSLTTAPYLVVQDTPDYSTPDAQVDVLRSLLADGDIELTSRRGNRTLTLHVLIEGSMTVTATAEAALIAETEKRINRLVCNPGDGVAPSFQFTVFQGAVKFVRDEAREAQGFRLYELTWRALPWVESATEVTVAALAASGSTTTLVDAMSATTNWTANLDGTTSITPTTATGQLTATSTSVIGTHTVNMIRTASITTSSTRYLIVDWKPGTLGAKVVDFTATADAGATAIAKVAEAASPTAGYTRTWFYVGTASSVGVLMFSLTTQTDTGPFGTGVSLARSLVLDNLDRSDVRPSTGSAKQQARTFPVLGSAPSTGSLAVSHASSALGDVLIYTCADDDTGYTPACRNFYDTGTNLTVDATACSGATNSASSTSLIVWYMIPARSLPEGEYLVVIRARGVGGVSSCRFTASPFLNSVQLPAIAQGGPISLASSATHSFYRMGMFHVPVIPQPNVDSALLAFQVTNASGTTELDETYLLNMTTGRLSQVALGTAAPTVGGTSNRLWLDAPSIENDGLGALWRGNAADRSDAWGAWVSSASPTAHQFPPGSLKVFSVASNPTTAVDVSYRYRPAWQNNAVV